MNKRRRVALVTSEYRTKLSAGGGVAAVTDFAYAVLEAAGYEVDIVSLRMSRRAPESRRITAPGTWLLGPVVRERKMGDRRVRDVGANFPELQMNRFRPRRVLDRLLREYDVALVVAGSPALCEPLSRTNIPVVLQVATFAKEERRGIEGALWSPRGVVRRFWTEVLGRMDERGLRIPEMTLVENRWMYAECSRRGIPVQLQPPGIDTDRFRPGRQPRVDPGYILSVGRLHDLRKDISLLVRAFAMAREAGLRQSLVLAGRRPPPDDVLDYIRDRGLTEAVRIYINPGPDELIALFQGADFFVLPSKEEGLGVVLVEAMACGLPVIATATKGAETVVTDDVGLLLPFGPRLEMAMAEAILEYGSAGLGLEMRRHAARARAVSDFSSQATGKAFSTAVEKAAAT